MNPWLIGAGLLAAFVLVPQFTRGDGRRVTVIGGKQNLRTDIRAPHPVEFVDVPLIKKRADAPRLEQLGGATGSF